MPNCNLLKWNFNFHSFDMGGRVVSLTKPKRSDIFGQDDLGIKNKWLKIR